MNILRFLFGFFMTILLLSCHYKKENSPLGTWQLTSWQTIADSGVQYPYGKDAKGILIYTKEGKVSLTLAYNKRDTFDSNDRSQLDAESAKKAFNSYFAYIGNYQVDPIEKKIKHQIELCLLPNWQGTEQIRNYQLLNNDSLVLSADRVLGKYHLLQWRRVN